MIKLIQMLLKDSESNSKAILRAKGRYKYPNSIKELKNYLKLKQNG